MREIEIEVTGSIILATRVLIIDNCLYQKQNRDYKQVCGTVVSVGTSSVKTSFTPIRIYCLGVMGQYTY